MFGYVRIHQQELKVKDYETYKAYYCGLCHELKKRYGRRGQLLLNYDMTFLAVLLSGLYEPEEQEKKRRCLVHPVGRHQEIISPVDAYAADLTVMLAYQKALDDWRDDRNPAKWALVKLLGRDYRKLRKAYPRQADALEKNIAALNKAEKENSENIDLVSGFTGAFLGEMFVWKDDLWQEDLRELGLFLGKYIYLMDAYDDLSGDRKKGNYNIWIRMQDDCPENFEAGVREILTDVMSRSAKAFERLPIIKNAEILRNILYAGVWLRYAALQEEKKKPSEDRMSDEEKHEKSL